MDNLTRKLTFIFTALAMLFLVFATYSNHFNNAFHFDDFNIITENAFIQDIKNIPRFFAEAETYSILPFNQVYRPLTSATFAVDYWIANGLKPVYFHITNFALYVLLGALLFFVFLKIMNVSETSSGNFYWALFATSLYVLHPANSETVNYISQRSEILAFLGIIGSFLLYINKPHWRKWHIYLVPMIIASFAKISALVFVPLLFFYILFFEKKATLIGITRKIKRTIKKTLPAFLIGTILFFFIQLMNSPTVLLSIIPGWQYSLSQLFAILHYFFTFFIPTSLNADPGWLPIVKIADARTLSGLIFILLLLTVAWQYAKQLKNRPIAFGILWFFIALIPNSSIFSLNEVINYHRPFISYAGLVLALVWWIKQYLAKRINGQDIKKWLVIAIGLIILFIVATWTYQRNKVWQSEEMLWHEVTVKNPQNVRGLMNYGVTQLNLGNYEIAKKYFKRAERIDPLYGINHMNLGIVEELLGNNDAVENHFQQAIQIDPLYPNTYFSYAKWLVKQGQSADAILLLTHALELSPGYSQAYNLLQNLKTSETNPN